MKDKRLLLVLVGHPLSGKDTVGKYLASDYGFEHTATGRLLRAYMKDNDCGTPTRTLMQSVANEVRARYGVDHFLRLALETEATRVVVDGLRTMGEIESARAAGCAIISVDAPIEKRYQWAVSRGRASDRGTFEEFAAQEQAENRSSKASEQSVDDVVAVADYVINNNTDLVGLLSATDELMKRLGINKVRKGSDASTR